MRAESFPAEPADPEPAPVASDSTGIARLTRLAHVWQTVSLHHPWVATRGVPWDSALIIAAPRVRSATDDVALADAYRRLFRLLRDSLSRIEPATVDITPPVSIAMERTDDSVLVLRIAPSAPLDAADSTLVAQAVDKLPRRVLLDLRGAAVRDNATRGVGNAGDAEAARLDAFLVRTGLAPSLISGTVVAPVERTRRVGIAPPTLDASTFHDGWQYADAHRYVGHATVARRVILLADSGTVLPPVLLALHDAGMATLVADGVLREAAPVSRVRVPVSNGLVAVVRVGELVHADGTVGVWPDTTMAHTGVHTGVNTGGAAGATGATGDAAMRTALAMLRAPGRLPVAERPRALQVAPAATPVFYDTTAYPFMGARLLGGFRLWSAMRARHAYRELYDDDLDAVFARVIPRFEAARHADEYAAAIAELAASLDDAEGTPQGASYESVVGSAAFPFRVRSAEGRVFITDVVRDSVTARLGLVPGTEITSVDGYPVVAWLGEHRRVAPAANDWSRLRAQMDQLTRGRATEVVVKVRDANARDANPRERTVSVPRRDAYRDARPNVERPAIERPAGAVTRLLADGVAYIDVERLTDATADVALNSVASARAIVLDLRGSLSLSDTRLLRRLATRPHAPVGRTVQRTLTAPCLASIREAPVECADVRESRMSLRPVDTTSVWSGRLVALIDERTQGAMERLAMSLEQMTTVTLIGSASAGSVSMTTPLSLPGGLTVGIATQELRRADGSQVQRVGLTPLVEARPTARGLRAGEDEVLARAQQWVQQQLEPPRRRRE